MPSKRDIRKALRSMRRRFGPTAQLPSVEAMMAATVKPTVAIGREYYLPYPEKVARVRVVAIGTGDFNLKRVPQNPVVIAEDGGEHVVSADILLEDELAAAIASAELAREVEEDS